MSTKFKRKKLSSSSKKWITRQKNNIFTKASKNLNIVCRSYFKLKEIQDKYKIIKKNHKVIDIGSVPGGWCQFVKEITEELHACDIVNNMEVSVKKFILGDFCDKKIQEKMENYDCILSDMAISSTGIKHIDIVLNHNLLVNVWNFAKTNLNKNGYLVIKIFQNEETNKVVNEIRKQFHRVIRFKPKSSHKESQEMFLLAFKRHTVL
ncbi:hypothetical protein AB836_01160 [Rickettsiales bacterium (ex Bugula neritina AB1)]|nr:hypothetical protein AB836_01160 [Rickettsiales bacterium (ex Bugula neritina AB1)]